MIQGGWLNNTIYLRNMNGVYNTQRRESLSNNNLDRIAMAKSVGVHRARVGFVIAIAERRQITANQ